MTITDSDHGAAGWRRIVITSSSSVLAPGVPMGAYRTSKSAITAFDRMETS